MCSTPDPFVALYSPPKNRNTCVRSIPDPFVALYFPASHALHASPSDPVRVLVFYLNILSHMVLSGLHKHGSGPYISTSAFFHRSIHIYNGH